MELLERAAPLAALDGYLATATAGKGSVVLLPGEAGIGKTSLARAFCAAPGADAQVLWGACDAMQTPRPLGPLYDIARAAGGELARLMLGGAARHDRFSALLDALVSPLRPVIVVIEDVHWADEATLDLLVFVSRRVAGTHAVVLVTYRDDELGTDHPLRTVLGSLATLESVHRMRLGRLSPQAVAQLAGARGEDPDQVYQVTGGNPFFVAQVLESGEVGVVPETVRDVVLARVMRLSPPARATLEAVAVVPDQADLDLVRAVTGIRTPAIEECEQAGLLRSDGRAVGFRHELARLAVELAIPAVRRPDRHAAVLAYLSGRPGADPARLAHHAEQAGDRGAVLTHAPAAALRAARLGAHREAVAHYERALRHAEALAPAEHAELLERYAEECVIADRAGEAIDATERAQVRWRALGDVARVGTVMARRAMLLCVVGRHLEADELAREAATMVERHPPGEATSAALAAVYTSIANVRMMGDDNAGAIEVGSRAIELAKRHGNPSLLARALNAVGSAYWLTDPDQAESTMVRCIAAARECGSDRMVSAGMVNLGSRAGTARRYRIAERWLRETVDFCAVRDMDSHRAYALAWLARCQFEQGRWPQAEAGAAEALAQLVGAEPGARMVTSTVLGRLRIRRGEADSGTALAEAWRLADQNGELQRRWPVAAGRAEAAWLAGQPAQIPALVDDTFRQAVTLAHPWAIGELGYWLWRAGAIDGAPEGAAEPYLLQIKGDWRGAAAAWEEIGCPYEAALARTDSDQVDDLRAALEVLHRLGARPAAALVTARLRALGVRRVPRGPHRRTAGNPGGLTAREMEVLDVLAEGLSNADIAARLHISPRTADHHVAAILAKLDVPTRHHAAQLAREWAAREKVGIPHPPDGHRLPRRTVGTGATLLP